MNTIQRFQRENRAIVKAFGREYPIDASAIIDSDREHYTIESATNTFSAFRAGWLASNRRYRRKANSK